MFTIQNYINTVRSNLQKESGQLIQQLSKTIRFNYYVKVDLLDYTAFIQPHDLSIMMYSMDGNANEVFYLGDDRNIFAGSYDLIKDISYFNVFDGQQDEFWEFYEQNDETISNLETKVFVEWFKDCWQQAGGKSSKLPSYFSFHDYDNCFDLQGDKWISDGDKWFE